MLERNGLFFHHCGLSCHGVMFQKQYSNKPKSWAQAAVREGTPPLLPRSDGTA